VSNATLELIGETNGLSLDFLDNSSDIVTDGVSVKSTATGTITFTRASSATVVNSSGLIETVSTNVSRLDHDPVTLAPRGLLIEEQRTNLLLNSDTLSTQSVTVSAVAHTLSFYGTGTITLSGVSTAGPLVGTGAYPNRVSLTFTPTAGTLTLTVSESVRQAQLETGIFPTSYIPTTVSTVTRSSDVATIATSSFPYSVNTSALIISASQLSSSALNSWLYSFDNGTGNDRFFTIVGPNRPVNTLLTSSLDRKSVV
jgi:hypothetical protein